MSVPHPYHEMLPRLANNNTSTPPQLGESINNSPGYGRERSRGYVNTPEYVDKQETNNNFNGMEGLQEGVIYSEHDIALFRRQSGLADKDDSNTSDGVLTKRERERADRKAQRRQQQQQAVREKQAQLQAETEAMTLDQIKELVREWMKTDDEINYLQQAVKDRRKKRDILHEKIIMFMKHHSIPHFNLSSGQLVCHQSSRKEGLSRKFLQRCLGKWFGGNNHSVSKMYHFLEDNRESKQVFCLKRGKKGD